MSAVLVPMKRFSAAKSRLRGHIDDTARAELARAMFERVLSAALSCELVTSTYVLTNGADVAALAESRGARVLADPQDSPDATRGAWLGRLIDWGLAALAQRGVTRAIVLMGDLPLIEPHDLRALCEALDAHDMVATPDQRATSTNALGVHLPFASRTAFGLPDSYAQHVMLARAAGLALCELTNARLAHDVDHPEDLSEVRGVASDARRW